MTETDIQQICLNGHQITDSYNSSPESRSDYCQECGEKTITQCQQCKAAIPGYIHYNGVVDFSGQSELVPANCHKCGTPYPWTERKNATAANVKKQVNFDPYLLVEKLCSRFHLVVRQLKNRYNKRVALDVIDEYDVQYLFHGLLKIFFDDIRPEEWTPSYAGKSSRMDFFLKGHALVVETKMTRKGLGDKEIGTQLIDDIVRYKTYPECKTLVCFVYDPEGLVANPAGLEKDLSRSQDGFIVKVLVVPKGY